MEFDVVVRGGLVFDGRGRLPVRADLGIMSDRITAIGSLETASAVDVVDAVGLSIAPGFIDSHTHSDMRHKRPERECRDPPSRIARQSWIDLVAFDHTTVIESATFESPLTPPIVIRHVFVNGRQVVKDGELTGARSGRVLSAA